MPRLKPTNHRRVIKLTDVGRLCENVEPVLSVSALKTEVVSTPEEHSCYEHNELSSGSENSDEAICFKMPWDDPSQEKFIRSIQPITPESFLKLFVERTEEECKEEGECPQKSPAWHKARAFSLTASQYGASVGHNKYMSRPALLRNKISPHEVKFPQEFVRWGVEHESHAEEAFELWLQGRLNTLYQIDHPGLLKHHNSAWTACSPDGILRRFVDGIEQVELIEYKAPAYHRDKVGSHPYANQLFNIPPMYFDQMQGSMWLIRNFELLRGGSTMKGGWFVVWQPHALSVTYVPYVEEYANSLMSEVKRFFQDEFVPACVEKINQFK